MTILTFLLKCRGRAFINYESNNSPAFNEITILALDVEWIHF